MYARLAYVRHRIPPVGRSIGQSTMNTMNWVDTVQKNYLRRIRGLGTLHMGIAATYTPVRVYIISQTLSQLCVGML